MPRLSVKIGAQFAILQKTYMVFRTRIQKSQVSYS